MKTSKRSPVRYHVPGGYHLHSRVVAGLVRMLAVRIASNEVLDHLAVYLAAGDPKPLLEACTPSFTEDTEEFYLKRQIAALISKYTDHPPSVTSRYNPEQAALDTWLDAEERCKRTNLDVSTGELNRLHGRLLFRMRSYIVSVLGENPDMEAVYSACRFTAGAARGVGGDLTNLARKFLASQWTCTPGARAYIVPALLRSGLAREGLQVCDLEAPPLADLLLKVRWVSGNKLSFVDKTMETKRSIAVEPLLNGYLQAGVDHVIRQRLLAANVVDLRRQEPNQELARVGSLTGELATIDLSSASDTIARLLVRDLLPYGWWELVDNLRSPFTEIEDGKHCRLIPLAKCFSMGNNFCFPLQTLIFSAVCHACGSKRYRVYGDDIIVESELYETVIASLRALGFVPNAKKSFNTGPFRESCGADWYNGYWVRPVYAKKTWNDVRNIASFHNIARQSWPVTWHWILDDLLASVPKRSRLLRPTLSSNGLAFNVPLDAAMSASTVRWNRDLQTWEWKEFHSMAVEDPGLEHKYWTFILGKGILHASGDKPFVYRRKARTVVRYSVGDSPEPIHWPRLPAIFPQGRMTDLQG